MLQNASHVPVVVTDAYVVAPRLTLIHQTGVRFHRFSQGGCSGGGPCPAPSFRIGSGWHPHPRPFTLAPGKLLGVELDLRLGSCADVPGANAAPISHLEVIYRRNGSSRHTVFALGSDALRLRRPKAEDCTFPRSTLWVNDPSHIGTNYYFTIPGSKGDVCTRTGHGLVFRSRAMKNNDRKPERIEIRFPSFAGTGMYGQAIAAAVVGGRTVFHTPALVEMTKATSREVFAKGPCGQAPAASSDGAVPHLRLDALPRRRLTIRRAVDTCGDAPAPPSGRPARRRLRVGQP